MLVCYTSTRDVVGADGSSVYVICTYISQTFVEITFLVLFHITDKSEYLMFQKHVTSARALIQLHISGVESTSPSHLILCILQVQ